MKPKVRAEFMPLLLEDLQHDRRYLKLVQDEVKQLKANLKRKERTYLDFQKRYSA